MIIHVPTLQGILFSTTECVKTPMDFVRLWLHEAGRVYGDKLVENKDMELLSKLKFSIAKDVFEVSCKECSNRKQRNFFFSPHKAQDSPWSSMFVNIAVHPWIL